MCIIYFFSNNFCSRISYLYTCSAWYACTCGSRGGPYGVAIVVYDYVCNESSCICTLFCCLLVYIRNGKVWYIKVCTCSCNEKKKKLSPIATFFQQHVCPYNIALLVFHFCFHKEIDALNKHKSSRVILYTKKWKVNLNSSHSLLVPKMLLEWMTSKIDFNSQLSFPERDVHVWLIIFWLYYFMS